MADLDDLNYQSISSMTTEEALEQLRQIRLSRRTVKSKTRVYREKVIKSKQPQQVDADQAAALLAILTGGNND